MRFFFIKLFVVLFAFSINAQNDGASLLKALQNKFNSIQNFTANVSQFVDDKPSLNAKIFFKKENNFRIEFGNSTIISDGSTSWNYNNKENKVIITNYEEDESLFSINFLVYKFPSQCTLKGEKEGSLMKLTLIPKGRGSNLNEVTLWINNDDLIEKVQTNDPATGIIELRFSNVKTNQNLPDSNFQFSAPEGSKVIDLR
jgi:outer membrane lipoprotein-sorting protein